MGKALSVPVVVFPPFRGLVSPAWLRGAVSSALEVAGALTDGRRWRVGVVVADEETVRSLNRDYRGQDEPTDVLSFSTGDSPVPGRGPRDLGEVVLCYPQALRQAQEAGRPVREEVAHLLVHGVLHLLDYDHEDPEDERRMRSLEERALALLQAESPH